jgi:hypothetical protein
VFFYEDLGGAMHELRERLGLNGPLTLPFAKADFRKDRRNYREILSDQDREKIGKVYAREIAYFDYEW